MWKRLTDELNQHEWNDFVRKNGPVSGRFLQSWEWGEFQGVERWICDRRALANIVKKEIPWLGSYAYCPRGPIVEREMDPALISLGHALGPILFFRFDPPVPLSDPETKKTIDVQPAHTWITDLPTSSDLLSTTMHAKTRYNIKLAERHGVQVSFDVSFEEVWPLFESTSKRSQFRLHPKSYYKKMLDALQGGECRAFVATALSKDEPIAANIMIDFAGVRTYLHGASSYIHRSLMAPHLLHWSLIQDAVEKGMLHYDWWGIAPSNKQNHPWAGITRFKKSFPGEALVYPGTYDLVKKPFQYKLYQLVRCVRRVTR